MRRPLSIGNPGPAGSDPAHIAATFVHFGISFSAEIWYFSADDGKHGREFFVAFNGRTRAALYDINPGPAGSDPGPFDSLAQETGLAAATSAAHGRELFMFEAPPVTGPGPGVATEVPGVRPGAGSDPVLAPTSLIGQPFGSSTNFWMTRTYFSGDDGRNGRQLWQADELVILGPGQVGTFFFDIDCRRIPGRRPLHPRDLQHVPGHR